MSRIFTIEKSPYDGCSIYKKSRIKLNPGVTVLVGCNGAGKTTLLHTIKRSLEKQKIPVVSYDNLLQGGNNAKSKAEFNGNIKLLAYLACSSEGEQIYQNLGENIAEIGSFVRNNADAKEIWLLFDAVDSGFSVDNIVEVKNFFNNILLPDNKDKDLYVIISANEYEMCRGQDCFDVINGKYVSFKDYEEYRDFILESRKLKDERYSV